MNTFIRADLSVLLSEHSVVHVVAVRAEVLGLPPELRSLIDTAVTLAYGLNMTVPIPDLRLTDDGIEGTLSFNGRGRYVVVPWGAILGLCDGLTGNVLRAYPRARQALAPVVAPPAPAPTASDTNVIHVDFQRRRRA